CCVGVLCEQDVAVVMEVADDGDIDSKISKPFDDFRHGGCGRLIIDSDTYELRSSRGECRDLGDGTTDVSGICVGHGLHHDRMVRPDGDVADEGRHRSSTRSEGHTGKVTAERKGMTSSESIPQTPTPKKRRRLWLKVVLPVVVVLILGA